MLDDDLLKAYRSTHYCVVEGDPFTLRIGIQSAEIKKVHLASAVSYSCFITAWNPFSEMLTSERNNQAQAELISVLNSKKLSYLACEGRDPTGNWPGEQSLLVLGCELQTGCELGQRFNQHAIVWIGSDAVPSLEILKYDVHVPID